MDALIYHNPACGTSRNTLELIRATGHEPRVVEHLKTPPSRDEVLAIAQRAGVPLRGLLRENGTPLAELGAGDPALRDDALLDAIVSYPVLLNRPIVVDQGHGLVPTVGQGAGTASTLAKGLHQRGRRNSDGER